MRRRDVVKAWGGRVSALNETMAFMAVRAANPAWMRELPLRAARQQWPARALAAFCLTIEAARMPTPSLALQPRNTISASARSQAPWSTFLRSLAPNCYGDVSSLLPKEHRNYSFEGLL